MKVCFLEPVEMTESQRARLEGLGDVHFFTDTTDDNAAERIADCDVVVVNWIDPSPFLPKMKSPSLVALMSTGYSWLTGIEDARKRDVFVSNIPEYASEAVGEHVVGLLLSAARSTCLGAQIVRDAEVSSEMPRGVELKGRTAGIIGLGNIGSRVAEILEAFGMSVITNNRRPRGGRYEDVDLETLLRRSDVICITCALNDESRGMISTANAQLIHPGAFVVGATWGVVTNDAIFDMLDQGRLRGFAFDAAFEGGDEDVGGKLSKYENVVLTPHVGFNTEEAIERQFEVCLANIEAFSNGKPQNVVN